jgi:hypothetical protein
MMPKRTLIPEGDRHAREPDRFLNGTSNEKVVL